MVLLFHCFIVLFPCYTFSMQILYEYLFLIPVVVLALSSITKVLIEGRKTEGKAHQHFFHPGGMPSTHSAFVTSLAIVVFKKAGAESVEFAIAFCFACIVWYDAVVTRRVIGQHGQLLNRMQNWHHFAEKVGHSLKEVIAGILFGALVTGIGIWMSELIDVAM
ncbi:MAG: divergent PAP2 family protein [Candidatus Peribacteraceae bacterium]|nr:divergent PAP2 family protein [Candidatus Peribacteraceae bacterium]